jgi:phage/plasmid primase-like uncharacterized protein
MPDTFDDAPPRLDVEGIKERVSCLDVADMLELDVRHDGKTFCWHGEEQTPSLHLYDDHWWCYRCGRGGDIIDMVIQLTDTTWVDAVRTLEKGALRVDPDRVVRKAEEPKATALELRQFIDANRSPWFASHDALCERRGYHPAIVRNYVYPLGEAGGALAIPHYNQGGLAGIKLVHADGRRTSVPGSSFKQLYEPTVDATWRRSAVVMEGESDAWYMENYLQHGDIPGIKVYALPSGAGMVRDEWKAAFEGARRVYVCMDNDRAGQEARDKLLRVIGWDRAEVLAVPQLYKDAREALTAGWEPNLTA